MRKIIDLTGKIFGKLTVLEFSHKDRFNDRFWVCECSCSNKTRKAVSGHSLRRCATKSCGCLKNEVFRNKYKIEDRVNGEVTTKKCSDCKNIKDLKDFGKDKSSLDGYNYRCKICANNHSKKFYKENTDIVSKKIKEYYLNNKERLTRKQRQYNLSHKKEKSGYDIVYRKNNKEKIVERQRKYQLENKVKVNLSRKKYYENNPNAKIAVDIRKSVLCALTKKKHKKFERTVDLLGCSMATVRLFIENQFRDGMNWENHGKVWQIDHVIPCAAFDFSEKEQRLDCFHYTNLQPLFCNENNNKKDKLPDGTRGKYYA